LLLYARPYRRSSWGHSFSKEAFLILSLQADLEAWAEPIISSLGYTLVEVEVLGSRRRPLVRFFIDAPAGITVDDCARVSREMGDLIEAEEKVPGSYVLEVSSPGATRPLKRERDYRLFLGRSLKVAFRAPFEGRTEVTGTLAAFEEGLVHVETAEGRLIFPLSAVRAAQLEL